MRYSLLLALVVLVLRETAGCTVRNRDVCCETDAECAVLRFDSTQPCAAGVCVANVCVDEGCDGPEDCTDSERPICEANQCVAAPPPGCSMSGGARIIFVSDRDGDEDIWAMFADGSSPQKLTENAVRDLAPDPTADGRQIAFIREGVSASRDVFVMAGDGTNATNLSNSVDAEDRVEWSPDQSMLAVSASTTAYLIKADGTGRRDLLGEPGGASKMPSWAPDSSRVVYVSIKPAPFFPVIWIVGRNGVGQTSSYSSTTGAETPRWSPDGKRVAYVDDAQVVPSTRPATIVVGGIDGTAPLFVTTTVDDSQPVWSPDSAKLAFVRAGDIWSMNVDGTDQRNLTFDGLGNAHPRWSPDGTSILYETVRNGTREVFRMSKDGANPTNLSKDMDDDHSAVWAPCPASN